MEILTFTIKIHIIVFVACVCTTPNKREHTSKSHDNQVSSYVIAYCTEKLVKHTTISGDMIENLGKIFSNSYMLTFMLLTMKHQVI